MSYIKKELIKIAYENPELRGELVPVIIKIANQDELMPTIRLCINRIVNNTIKNNPNLIFMIKEAIKEVEEANKIVTPEILQRAFEEIKPSSNVFSFISSLTNKLKEIGLDKKTDSVREEPYDITSLRSLLDLAKNQKNKAQPIRSIAPIRTESINSRDGYKGPTELRDTYFKCMDLINSGKIKEAIDTYVSDYRKSFSDQRELVQNVISMAMAFKNQNPSKEEAIKWIKDFN
jgi:hypothetical protein